MEYKVSISRACSVVQLPRSMWYYRSKRDDTAVIAKLNELAELYPTRGFEAYYGRIRESGLPWNRKKVLRIYRMLKMNLRRKRKRRLPSRIKEPLKQPVRPNDTWSADFMSDAMADGRRIRILNILDDFNREALCVDPQFSYPAERVLRRLEVIAMERGLPKRIRVDNGPEFISHAFQDFCTLHDIEIKFIQPGKPTQNAYIERFNRLYREDVLDAYLFTRIEQVRQISEEWRRDYNQNHPHKSLGRMSPIRYMKENKSNYFINQHNKPVV